MVATPQFNGVASSSLSSGGSLRIQSGKDVAIFGKPAEKMRILRREVVAVFAHALALLRHVEDFAVIALAVEEIFAPGDAVADTERIATHVGFDAIADGLDAADDLMAKNSRTRIRPAPFVGVNIRTADRRHRRPHQHFAAFDGTQRKPPQHKRRVRRVVHGGNRGARLGHGLSHGRSRGRGHWRGRISGAAEGTIRCR
jgi:hypothetical protein